MGIQTINEDCRRLEWIDALKGFAILWVVLGHVLLGYGENHAFEASFNSVILSAMNWIYTWHMPLFFVISGYTFRLAYVKGNGGQIQVKHDKVKLQLINLLGIYLLFQVALCVLKALFSAFVDNGMDISDLLNNIVIPNTLMWYIWVLMIYYILFSWLVSKNIVSNKVFLAAMFVLAVVQLATEGQIRWGLAVGNLVHNLFYFAVGAAGLTRPNRKIRISVLAFICLTASVFWMQVPYQALSAMAAEVIAITVILIVVRLFEERNVVNPILVLLGKKSLVIYLLHTYFVTALKVLFIRTGMCNPYTALPIILISWIIPVIATCGVAMLCDKWRWLGWIFRPVSLLGNKRAGAK